MATLTELQAQRGEIKKITDKKEAREKKIKIYRDGGELSKRQRRRERKKKTKTWRYDKKKGLIFHNEKRRVCNLVYSNNN